MWKQAAKWVIGVTTACILIYLGLRRINAVTAGIVWFLNIVKPLLFGIVFALILNVPMGFIEQKLLSDKRFSKIRRPLSIVLSLLFIIGLLSGIAILVIPELADAIKLLVQIVTEFVNELDQMEESALFAQFPWAEYVLDLNIDWGKIGTQIGDWFTSKGGFLVNQAVGAAGSVLSGMITFVLALIFSIYILSQKERLKRQVCRLIRVWLPARFGTGLIHVASVCNNTFKLFIAGQATEAIILGTLCMVGMLLLQLPYAPMIGALIGFTALIPVVGAFVGTFVGAVMILTVSPYKALIFVIFLLILQQVEGNIIYPRVVGSKINLPAIWVLAAVTIGGNLAGAAGMLLGVPFASAAYALIKEATETKESKEKTETAKE